MDSSSSQFKYTRKWNVAHFQKEDFSCEKLIEELTSHVFRQQENESLSLIKKETIREKEMAASLNHHHHSSANLMVDHHDNKELENSVDKDKDKKRPTSQTQTQTSIQGLPSQPQPLQSQQSQSQSQSHSSQQLQQLQQQQQQQQLMSNGKAFNSQAFYDVFQDALNHLKSLRAQVDKDIVQMTLKTSVTEDNYKEHLTNFMEDLQEITRTFRDLDTSISKVSQTAVNIGDQLESVEQQRESILSTQELIDHFMRFNSQKIDPMFSETSGEKLYDASDLILQLKAIASEMTSRDVNKAKTLINTTADNVKKCLKNEFIKAFPLRDIDTMRECAKRLQLFYRDNQVPGVTSSTLLNSDGNAPAEGNTNNKMEEMKINGDTWEQTLDEFLTEFIRGQIDFQKYAYDTYENIGASLDAFSKAVASTFEISAKQIVKIFLKPSDVIQALIEKIMKEQVKKFVNSALNPILTAISKYTLDDVTIALMEEKPVEITESSNLEYSGKDGGKNEDSPHLTYVKTVHILYVFIKELLQKLKRSVLDILFEGNVEDAQNNLSAVLAEVDILQSLFKEHIMKAENSDSESRYFTFEKEQLERSMKHLIWSQLVRMLNLEDEEDITEELMAKQNAKKQKTGRKVNTIVIVKKGDKERQMQFDRLKDALDTKVNELIPRMCRAICNPNIQKGGEETKARGMSIIGGDANTVVMTAEALSERLRMEGSKGVLDRLADIYSPPLYNTGEKLSENAHVLFMLLLEAVEKMLLQHLLPVCRATLPKANPTDIKNKHYFDAVKTINGGIQLVEEFFVNFVLPHMSDMNEQSVCVDTKNAKYAVFEKEILSGLQQLLQATINYIARQLKEKQKKTDYKPKVDDSLEKTPVCHEMLVILNDFRKKSMTSLDGRNLDRFFLIFGTRFYHILVDHLKTMQVSELGCMILTQDLKAYRDAIANFHIERVDELFLNLIEKVQLLGVAPESVQDLIHTAKWSNNLEDVTEWLKVRTDYKTAKLGPVVFGQE